MRHVLILTAILALAAVSQLGSALNALAQDGTPLATLRPNAGWDLHIDAQAHLPGDPAAIAHHYCKPVANGMFECLLFASDTPDVPLVGVEAIVGPETWQRFDDSEQALWHYHREEIPLVNAVLPDLSEEEAAEIVPSLENSYGKVYLLWDPTAVELPTGQPFVHDVRATTGSAGTATP